MSDNSHKFLFLGVMLFLAVIASRGTAITKQSVSENDSQAKISSAPPLFVLQPPSKIPGTGSDAGNSPAASSSGNVPDVQTQKALNSGNGPATSSPQDYGGPGGVQYPDDSGTPGAVQSSNSPVKPIFYRYGSVASPAIGAREALVADLLTGQAYFTLKPDMRWPLASITKLMTAAITTRDIAFNQSTTLTAADFPSDNSPDMTAGNRFTIGDLRLAMLVESNNEAAEALANFYGYANFIAAMNSQAKEWGMNNTNYDESVGLSAANQSTANDLLLLTRNIYGQYRDIFRITTNKSVNITELNSGRKITIKNINIFAGESDFLGGKTGYTDEADGNLLSIFSYEKRPILVIVLGADDRFGDTHNLINWFENNYK